MNVNIVKLAKKNRMLLVCFFEFYFYVVFFLVSVVYVSHRVTCSLVDSGRFVNVCAWQLEWCDSTIEYPNPYTCIVHTSYKLSCVHSAYSMPNHHHYHQLNRRKTWIRSRTRTRIARRKTRASPIEWGSPPFYFQSCNLWFVRALS